MTTKKDRTTRSKKEVAPATEPKTRRARTSRRKKKEPEALAVAAPAPPPPLVLPAPVLPPVVTAPTRTRKIVNRETVTAHFDTLCGQIDQEIDAVRTGGDKGRLQGIRFLRKAKQEIGQLRRETTRVFKQKRRNPNASRTTTSGFMKPVEISKEMSRFTGRKPEELKSRVDVTKYICQYIRDHDLQNPEDRREIIPDRALTDLLDIKTEDPNLTYYTLQKMIQPHFPKAKV